MLPWQNSKGFGSVQSEGHIRCDMQALDDGYERIADVDVMASILACKKWFVQMTFDHYRSAIGASAICLFG